MFKQQNAKKSESNFDLNLMQAQEKGDLWKLHLNLFQPRNKRANLNLNKERKICTK